MHWQEGEQRKDCLCSRERKIEDIEKARVVGRWEDKVEWTLRSTSGRPRYCLTSGGSRRKVELDRIGRGSPVSQTGHDIARPVARTGRRRSGRPKRTLSITVVVPRQPWTRRLIKCIKRASLRWFWTSGDSKWKHTFSAHEFRIDGSCYRAWGLWMQLTSQGRKWIKSAAIML